MLDIDGFRVDKGIQITADAQGELQPKIASSETNTLDLQLFFVVVLVQNFFLSAPLRPQLEVSLVQHQRRRLVHGAPHNLLLRLHLGRHPLPLQLPLALALLDPPRLRHRSPRPPLVPDALGHLGNGPVHPPGRLLRDNASTDRPRLVTVARRPRCPSGRRFRDDPAPDSNSVPYHVHTGVRTGAGERGNYRREGRRARQTWAGCCVSEFGDSD